MATLTVHNSVEAHKAEVNVNHLKAAGSFTALTIRYGADEVSFLLANREAALALYFAIGDAIQAADEKDTAGPSAAPVDDDDVFEINGPVDDDDEPTAGQYNTTSGQWNKRAQG